MELLRYILTKQIGTLINDYNAATLERNLRKFTEFLQHAKNLAVFQYNNNTAEK